MHALVTVRYGVVYHGYIVNNRCKLVFAAVENLWTPSVVR